MPAACGSNTTTTLLTMATERSQTKPPSQIDEHASNSGRDSRSPSPPPAEYEFNEAQCLFCNQISTDLDHNVTHMAKTHGLHIAMTDLAVDVGSLLAYFHLVISGYYECLFCGTQRNTRQAVQQHMIGKGHCKYDLADKDSEFRDFYDLPSSEAEEDIQQRLSAMRVSDDLRAKKARQLKRSEKQGLDTAPAEDQQPTSASTSPSRANADSSVDAADVPSQTQELSTRAQKKEHTINSQLSHLRAADRQNLIHLPASQQRALLATHHKQMEKARRSEQHKRGRLESEGNLFGRLGTTRLLRLPPHFGHVQGLNR
jgi:pre-60S factor REI1